LFLLLLLLPHQDYPGLHPISPILHHQDILWPTFPNDSLFLLLNLLTISSTITLWYSNFVRQNGMSQRVLYLQGLCFLGCVNPI